ncbi:pyroglutamyl-peptidase I [Ideonella sp. 4Y11]|uniref:Pyroglutamyl-peptidase I n=1 Tax=Ideonella aquatica TaxID=2824119 RepID=A0A941BMY8_9BURK|nr:pyroglutamyl-peptidase I [Ideonella aquatica]MBQ0961379.1 pyroglutamyl-peptidase I [Ideonella aquatica]
MTAPWLLLTGFEPFAGDALNPSWELARQLDGERLGTWTLRSSCLPCSFDAAASTLRRALADAPSAVVCLGLAGARAALSVERVAVNLVDARIPDNDGAQPTDQAVVTGAPAAYFSRLPVKAMVHAAQQVGVPAELSLSAGSFVCNQVFYSLLHALRRRPRVPAGFVHVPWASGMGADPGAASAIPLDDQLRGLRAMLACVVAGGPDRRDIGGTIS